MTWAGGSFHPDRFDPDDVSFDDPDMRWRVAYLDEEYDEDGLGEQPIPVTYENRVGNTYYLHLGRSKRGKPIYHFSKKEDGALASEIPEGFEVYETPDARVYLRRIPPEIITDEERELVSSGVRAAGVEDYIIDVKKKTITVYLADMDEESFSQILKKFGSPYRQPFEGLGFPNVPIFREQPSELLRTIQTYSPLMRFVLEDKENRTFVVERAVFSGSTDAWTYVDGPDHLQKMVKKYCKHLGKDSFYDLG